MDNHIEDFKLQPLEDAKFIKTSFKSNKRYDIVFHGENHEAKGIEYILKLAQNLLNYNTLIVIVYNFADIKVWNYL